MCIAILNRAGFTLPKETLERCWRINPDGGGLAWVDTDKDTGKPFVNYYKTLVQKDMIETYDYIRAKFPDSHMLVHFRITTCGGTNYANCHPFPVTSSTRKPMMLIHNGMISGYGSTNRSDTNEFCSDFLSMLPAYWEDHEPTRKLVAKEIGGYSKLVLLRSDNEFFIINEDKGIWDTELGSWFSNDGFRPFRQNWGNYGGYNRGNYRPNDFLHDDYEDDVDMVEYYNRRYPSTAAPTEAQKLLASAGKSLAPAATGVGATSAAAGGDDDDALWLSELAAPNNSAEEADLIYPYTCPNCGASPSEIVFDNTVQQFFCHGHADYIESLEA